MNYPVILVDIITDVINSMNIPGKSINFIPGRNIQIISGLISIDNNPVPTPKYPLIAMVMPIKETRSPIGYYATVNIGRIVIATLTNLTDSIQTRYLEGGTYKSTLYPCYYEFLNKLAMSHNIINNDPGAFKHTKMDNPGTQPIGEGLIDAVDIIEILNLELTLKQIVN